jgi:DNA-binding transcriptional LysR family regulator
MNMTIRHLRIFVAVCASKSITAAAGPLYMSQPAVSLAIKEIEEHYGIRLFDRLARNIQITADGKRMLDYAIHIVDLFDDMERAMRNADAIGEMRIGCSLTIGACLMPAYVNQLVSQYPTLKPRISVDNSNNIVQSVCEGRLDIGLVEGVVNNDSLIVTSFMADNLVAVCGCGHPFAESKEVCLDDFLAQPLLLRERGSGTRELFQSAVTLLGKQFEPAWESVSTTALIRAVEAGNGVSVLPELLVAESLMAGRLRRVPLQRPVLSRSFYLVYHKNKYLSTGMRTFINLVTA